MAQRERSGDRKIYSRNEISGAADIFFFYHRCRKRRALKIIFKRNLEDRFSWSTALFVLFLFSFFSLEFPRCFVIETTVFRGYLRSVKRLMYRDIVENWLNERGRECMKIVRERESENVRKEKRAKLIVAILNRGCTWYFLVQGR